MARILLLCLFVAPLPAAEEDDLVVAVERMVEVFNILERKAADPFDPAEAIYNGAIPAMVRTLDPHSAFLSPEQFESLKEMQRSTEKGFGSVLSVRPGRAMVLQTLPGSPSAKSGMSPGDEIVVVNGYPLAQLSMDQLVSLLAQTRQKRAELMLQRPNYARLIPVTLAPEELADPSVQQRFFLEEGVAYIKVANFESGTDRELREAIEEMGGEALKGLVVDYRGNPGGVIEAAVRIAAMFLEPDQRILWIRGRGGPREEVRTPKGSQPFRFPLAILIDERSASAAELVTGALQDHDRAQVLGVRSFGKGLVQSVFELSDNAGLALTTALYLSPSGRPIQRPLSDCADLQFHACEQQEAKTYTTDSGREIPGGGGIAPDRIVYPRAFSRFEAVMLETNSFLEFAREFAARKQSIDEDFEVTPQILDEFQLYLSKRRIRPNLSEWTATLEFIRERLKQEILNLMVGVSAGDEVELRADPQVRAALESLR